ncbi:MAG: hypothetical protein ABL984_00350 [Pyrinomonadaceae bacterium]
MPRSGVLGSVAGQTNTRGGRGGSGGGATTLVRKITTIAGGLNWADGSASTLLTDGSVGDNSTYERQTGGPPSIVVGLYDLGSARVVTRVRKRHGNTGGNDYPNAVEASNDGTTWVNANTGSAPPGEVSGPTHTWRSEIDLTSITATPYRYWRVVNRDPGDEGGAGDARLGDFRLYIGGVLLVP